MSNLFLEDKPLMQVYYDTEFLELPNKPIRLISIGMVTETGKEYYAINAAMPQEEILQHEWLTQNVVPYLPWHNVLYLDTNHPDVKWPEVIRREISEFLLAAITVEGVGVADEIELWGWYSAYDHVVLAQLFGVMAKLPPHIPMYTNDIRQEFQRYGNPRAPEIQSERPHNALADAYYHKALHEFIMGYGQQVRESQHYKK